MSRWTRALCCALLLVVVGGCTHRVGDGQATGSAHRGAPGTDRVIVPPSEVAPSRRVFENPDKLTAEDALGDLALFNPCSVVDPGMLPDTWTSVVRVPVAFEFCDLEVTTDDGAVVQVNIGQPHEPWNDPADHPSGAREAGISIIPGDPESRDGCNQDIVFADGVALVVSTYTDTTMGAPKNCTVSETIADQVVTAVLDGRAESIQHPDGSLGSLDACTLLGPELLALVPGLGANAQKQESITGHSCWWGSPDLRAVVNIEFQIGHLPVGGSGTTLHGRYTATSPYDDTEQDSLCEVTGEHIPFEYKDEMAILERVAIYVWQPGGQLEAACAAANAVANGLWPELPPL